MTTYADQTSIRTFLKNADERPLFVCDMDGNVLTGYSLVDPNRPLQLNTTDNPQNQAIPFGSSQGQLDELVRQGILKKGIFAEKAMDARLPQSLVDFVNDSIETNQPFRIAFLTSRGAKDAQKILEESGVNDVSKVTLVADSGASLYIKGQKTEVRSLTDEESAYLKNLDNLVKDIHAGVEKIVKTHFPEADIQVPALFVEHKGIATNIHYRGVLTAFSQADNSELDKEIGVYIKSYLQSLVEHGPKDKGGAAIFKTLDAPAAVEMKVASINKGDGLEAIIRASIDGIAFEQRPTAVIFSGDDVAKGNGTPGTDWYAMDRARSLSLTHGIPVFNVHTHHPVANDLSSDNPDPNKDPSTLSAAFPKPPIDLVVKSPEDLVRIILSSYYIPENFAALSANNHHRA